MSTKPTTTEVGARVETDLGADDLQRIIDAAHADVVLYYGEDSQHVEHAGGGERYVYLTRQSDSITAVVESVGETDTTLSSDDYDVTDRGWSLRRTTDGTNPRGTWNARVKVTYVPEIDRRRFDVVVDLVKLSLANSGFDSESTGDYSTAHTADYATKRRAILSRLESSKAVMA